MAYAVIPHTVQHATTDIPKFLLIEAINSTIASILVFFFFRGAPPIPPSFSAAVDKLKFADAFKILFQKLNFLIMFFVFAITLGSALAFSGNSTFFYYGISKIYLVVLDQVVAPEGYTTVIKIINKNIKNLYWNKIE